MVNNLSIPKKSAGSQTGRFFLSSFILPTTIRLAQPDLKLSQQKIAFSCGVSKKTVKSPWDFQKICSLHQVNLLPKPLIVLQYP